MSQPTFEEWAGRFHWGLFDPSGEGWSHAVFTLDPTYRTGGFNESGGGLPFWIARYASGAGEGDPNYAASLAWDAYNRVFAPDRSGRQPWGTEGFPFDGAGEPTFFNTLPPVTINGLRYFRTGEAFGAWRARAEPEFAAVLAKLPASIDQLHDATYGYLVPEPVMAAIAPIALRIHAGGGWSDALPMLLAGIATGAIVGPALMQWAASGFDLTGLATEFAGETVAVDVPGYIAGDSVSIFDDLGDFSGWQLGDVYTVGGDVTDLGDLGDIATTGDGPGSGINDGEWQDYTQAGDSPVTTAGDDAQYAWHDVSDAYGGTPPETVTPQQLTTADIEDADAGQASRRLTQTLKTGGSGSGDLLKTFKDAAGAVYKLVVQQNGATGQKRVVPQQVRLANGQYATVNAAGQIVGRTTPSQTMLPYQFTGSQLTATLKQYALPIGLSVGAVLLYSSLSRR